MRCPFAAAAALGAATAVLSLAGCGSSSTAPSTTTSFKSLTSAQQVAFEGEVIAEVQANIGSLTSFDPYSGFGFDRVVSRRAGALVQLLGSKHTEPRFQIGSGCITETGNPNDEDGDGVPDSVVETWKCGGTSNGADSTIGTFSYSDPTPNGADLDYNATESVALTETGTANGDLSLTLKGSSSLTNTAGSISESGNAAFDASVTNSANGNGTVKLTANNATSYSYSGALLTSFGSLPAGTFNLTGNWTYVVTAPTFNADLSFSVSTPGGLSINPTCTANTSHIASGEADIKFNDGTLVKAIWTTCPASPSFS